MQELFFKKTGVKLSKAQAIDLAITPGAVQKLKARKSFVGYNV